MLSSLIFLVSSLSALSLTTPLPLPNHDKPLAIADASLAKNTKFIGSLMGMTNGLVHTASQLGGSLSHTGGSVAHEAGHIAGGLLGGLAGLKEGGVVLGDILPDIDDSWDLTEDQDERKSH